MQSGSKKSIPIHTGSKSVQQKKARHTNRRQVPMSKENLHQVFSLLGSGQRLQSCDLLRQSLNVNDFMAEWCIRHIEDCMGRQQDFVDQAIAHCENLHQDANPDTHRTFLSRVLGIHGHAASGLLAKYLR